VVKVVGKGAEPNAVPATGWVAGQCAWSGGAAGFILSVGTAGSLASFDPAVPDAQARLAAFRAADTSVEDVADLGDGAAIGAGRLAVADGEVYYEIMSLGATDQQLRSLAKLVVAGP
jgi:hypothetical protein